MTSRLRFAQITTLALGVALSIAGCGSSSDGAKSTEGGASSRPSVAADVPAGYDPCKDIPKETIDSEQFRQQTPADSSNSAGIKWHGCQWAKKNGYAVTIQTTNITIDMVRTKNFQDTRELTIGGRRAIASRQVEEHPQAVCTVDIEMKGGSLEFNLTNPPSDRGTGNQDTCELGRMLAERIVPTIPANA
ncbi:DUF3558 domain-containing protein [Nocardia panacis]|uniref:DUF3558 domain-containing protein n=1 Tax=Nocardia panacis TaxID=2340916 RepID=A0A3A4JZ98_9NOCA|nr:DUF3558 domain-containing protein [Nocardia panacis]RJO69926.1 DUF3558 domain-containing protein [Nocardia panacis]